MSLRLKFEVLCRGISLSRAAVVALPSFRSGAVVVRDYPTTSGLVLRLSHEHYANARVRVDARDALRLDHEEGIGYFLDLDGDRHVVEVHSPAKYAIDNRRLSTGKSIRVVANTHADRVRLTPIYGCRSDCQFCNFPGMVYRRNSIDELVEGLSIALEDRIIKPAHVLISGGSPRNEEHDYLYLNDVYKQLPSRFPGLRFDIMLAPRTLHVTPRTPKTYENFARRLKEWGHHSISVNLELNGEEARRRYIPEKASIGYDAYLTFMEYGVKYFGVGEVRSVLLVGIEPEEETLAAVDALAARGVFVELSPFTPFPGTIMARHPEPTPDDLMSVFDKALDISTRRGVPIYPPFCYACSHNVL